MYKISVIIPVYNVEKYLRECLDSVVNQTLKDIEIICVNDGSTDSSFEILKEYAKNDNRIKILTQENKGAGPARNYGLDVAAGEYLSFLDADDLFEKELLEKLYNKITQEKADIAICDADMFDSEGNSYHLRMINTKYIPQKENFNKDDISENFYDITLPASWNKLYRKDFIINNGLRFQDISTCNDVAFGYLALSFADAITVCPEVLLHYRQSNSNISSSRYKHVQNILLAYNFIKECLYNKNLTYLLPDLRKRIYSSHIQYELSLCNKKWQKYFYKMAKNILKEDYGVLLEGEHIPVVVACDNSYAAAATVCLYSILQKTNSYIDFIILSSNLSSKNYKKLCKSIKKFKNYSIKLVEMNNYNLEKFPKIHRFHTSCYARYFIPEICANYNKVIYTDADVIFKKNIKEYYEIDLEGYGIAASSEELGTPRNLTDVYNFEVRKKKFSIDSNHEYFANGNLIIDCDYWRKHKITEQLIEITNKFGSNLIAPDLDAMNVCFQNNYKRLDYKYCVCVHRYNYTDGNKEMIIGFNDPFIIHYSGDDKPWNTDKVVLFDEFFNILKKTKFLFSCSISKKYFISNIFSIHNEGIHKVITIFGIKLKIKSKKLIDRKRFDNINKQFNDLKNSIEVLNENLNNANTQTNNLKSQIDKLKLDYDKKLEEQELSVQKKLDTQNSDIETLKNWQSNFYKYNPDKYPIRLSEPEIEVLCSYYKKSKNYLEFGAGGSTFLATMCSDTNIHSVESDKNWLNYLKTYFVIKTAVDSSKIKFYHVDIGKTKEWGYPVSDEKIENYPDYSTSVYASIKKEDIDLVFIDGRFRVACVLAAILNCQSNVTILIHDYTIREYYHIIEEFLEVIETIDTLAVFKLKNNIDKHQVAELYEKYKYVKE